MEGISEKSNFLPRPMGRGCHKVTGEGPIFPNETISEQSSRKFFIPTSISINLHTDMACSRIGIPKTMGTTTADGLFYLSDSRDEQPQRTSENKIKDDVLRVSLACHVASNNSHKLANDNHSDTNGALHLPSAFLL